MLALSLNVQGERGRTARDDAWMPRTRLPPESQEPIGSLQSELCHHKSMLNDWYIIIFPPLSPSASKSRVHWLNAATASTLRVPCTHLDLQDVSMGCFLSGGWSYVRLHNLPSVITDQDLHGACNVLLHRMWADQFRIACLMTINWSMMNTGLQ